MTEIHSLALENEAWALDKEQWFLRWSLAMASSDHSIRPNDATGGATAPGRGKRAGITALNLRLFLASIRSQENETLAAFCHCIQSLGCSTFTTRCQLLLISFFDCLSDSIILSRKCQKEFKILIKMSWIKGTSCFELLSPRFNCLSVTDLSSTRAH